MSNGQIKQLQRDFEADVKEVRAKYHDRQEITHEQFHIELNTLKAELDTAIAVTLGGV